MADPNLRAGPVNEVELQLPGLAPRPTGHPRRFRRNRWPREPSIGMTPPEPASRGRRAPERGTTDPRTHQPVPVVVALLLLFAGPLSCGGGTDGAGGGGAPDAQPAPGVTTFTEGDFEDLPLPPRAQPAGERTDRDGVATRSFLVRDTTPEEVLAFYRSVLAEASMIERPLAIGPASFSGRWLLDGRELHVTAGPAPGAETSTQELVTQFNLELRPT